MVHPPPPSPVARCVGRPDPWWHAPSPSPLVPRHMGATGSLAAPPPPSPVARHTRGCPDPRQHTPFLSGGQAHRGGQIHGGAAPSSLSGGQAHWVWPDPWWSGPLLPLRWPGVSGRLDPAATKYPPPSPLAWSVRVGRIYDGGAWALAPRLGSPVGLLVDFVFYFFCND